MSRPRHPHKEIEAAVRYAEEQGSYMKKTKPGAKVFQFTLILQDLTEISDRMCNRLYAEGCDDSLPGSQEGHAFLDFHRKAANFHEAVFSAVQSVETALKAKVARVEAEDPPVVIQFIHRAKPKKQLASSKR